MPFRCRLSFMAHATLGATTSRLFTWRAQGQPGNVWWNRFHGPNGQGIAEAGRIPVHFSPETNMLWETAVPAGSSSPVLPSFRPSLSQDWG